MFKEHLKINQVTIKEIIITYIFLNNTNSQFFVKKSTVKNKKSIYYAFKKDMRNECVESLYPFLIYKR